MKKLEKISLYIAIVLMFSGLIWFVVAGIWETQVLKPLGKYISNTPQYFWMESLLGALIGGSIIIGLFWGLLVVFRIEKNKSW